MIIKKYLFIICFISFFSRCTKEFNDYNNELVEEILIIDACLTTVPVFSKETYNFDFSFLRNYYNNNNILINDTLKITSNYLLPSVYEYTDSYVRLRSLKSRFEENVYLNYTTNAIVIIKDDLGNIDTLKTIQNTSFNVNKYRNPCKFDFKLQKILPIPGHTYFLEVYYKNKKYTAQTTIPLHRPAIDSIVNQFDELENESSHMNYKTMVYFKDLPNEKNYYYFKYPNSIAKDIIESYLNDSIKGAYQSFGYRLNGYFTNVINDQFLTTTTPNKIYGYLGTWNDVYASDNYETGSIHNTFSFDNLTLTSTPKLNYIFNVYPFLENEFRNIGNIFSGDQVLNLFQPYFLFNFKYVPTFSVYGTDVIPSFSAIKELLFGTIDETSYNYFNKMKQLYKTDGETFSPSPVTPTTNIQGGALGFFYGINAFPYTNLGWDMGLPDGRQYKRTSSYSKGESPPFKYPFSTIQISN